MPYTTQTSDFWGWYLRHNVRTVWKNLADAGIDLFAAGPSNNPQAFLTLQNILPATNMGFSRRWGTTVLSTPTAQSPSIVRTFLYNYPQDASNPGGTANTNLIIGTDNQNFYPFKDTGAAYGGHSPVNFAAAGSVNVCNSRGWIYYSNGVSAPQKVNPSITAATNSNMGIALPTQPLPPGVRLPSGGTTRIISPISELQIYPSVWNITGTGYVMGLTPYVGVAGVTITTPGSGQSQGTYTVAGVGGGGTGAVVTYQVGSSGTVFLAYVSNSGSGYTSAPTFTVAAGGTPGTLTAVIDTIPVAYLYSGVNYQNTDTVTITDPTGTGTGATGTLIVDTAGRITGFNITAGGSHYSVANASISSVTGTGGGIVLYVKQTDKDINGNLLGTGPVVGWDLGGPISFASGRKYAVALQNSSTGHTSDVYISSFIQGPKSGTGLDNLTSSLDSTNLIPISSSTTTTAGFSGLSVGISLPGYWLAPPGIIDTQVDTILLLAAADGQGMDVLYEVASFPLSGFTSSRTTYVDGVFYQLWYLDTLPDTYNDTNIEGDTLLSQNIWTETDSSGNTNGISLNTPPPATMNYITQHQGRLFGTDGKTVFYSKSLEEVTTSTGLITSKWEECWPGDYQLPLALNNEQILGMRSDGTSLHVGTERSIFSVYGDGPNNFSVPSVAFSETGILHNDLWTVIYAEGQPSGFVWLTQDFKVMHSDFSTYREIGTSVYPILQNIDVTKLEQSKAWSLTQGPYNFVFLQFWKVGQTAPTLLLWETRLGKWYQWTFPVADTTSNWAVGPAFVYQYPKYTASSFAPGTKFLFYWTQNTNLNELRLSYFDPTTNSDRGTAFGWSVQTSWQDLGDPTAVKTINEIEVTSDDGAITVTLYGASSQGQFDSPVTLKTGNTIQGPISSLASQKFYCAGTPTAAKYYSLAFTPQTPTTSAAALTSFSIEAYPMARI